MDIKKPTTPPAAPRTPTAEALLPKGTLAEATSTETVAKMTDMEKHVQGFADIPQSQGKGVVAVTAASTQEVLEALGLKVEASGVLDIASAKIDERGGELLTSLFAKRQGHPEFVETAKLAEVGVRGEREGPRGDTGMFDKATGMIDAQKAAQWWVNTGDGKDHLTAQDIRRYLNGPGIDVLGLFGLHKPGKALNALEFTLLFDLAAVKLSSGEKVLTKDRFLAFIDGTLWRDLAQARADGKLYEPVKIGASMHGGSAGKVAMEIAKLTAAYGGPTDAGTQALHQAKLTIDTEASLKYQQSEKTLVPTLLGAVRALCPVGGASGLQKAATKTENPEPAAAH